jgi:hypothetical protein
VDVRNRAVDVLSIAGPQFLEIDLDGQWYSHEPAGSLIVGPFDKLAPEDEVQGYELPLWLPWLSKDKPNQGLDLGEGRHALRVALIGKAGTHAIRAVSNLLEVEVLSESATDSAAGGGAAPRGSSAGSQPAQARSSVASDVSRLQEELRGLERQVDTETRLRGRGETHPTIVALRKRIALASEWLAWAKTKAVTQSSDSSSEVARLEEELRRLERQVDTETRLNQMTETHPAVVALRKRIALVKEWLDEAKAHSATGPASRPASRPWPESLPTSLRFDGGEDQMRAEMFLERYKHPGPIGPYESVPAATTTSRPGP